MECQDAETQIIISLFELRRSCRRGGVREVSGAGWTSGTILISGGAPVCDCRILWAKIVISLNVCLMTAFALQVFFEFLVSPSLRSIWPAWEPPGRSWGQQDGHWCAQNKKTESVL